MQQVNTNCAQAERVNAEFEAKRRENERILQVLEVRFDICLFISNLTTYKWKHVGSGTHQEESALGEMGTTLENLKVRSFGCVGAIVT